MIFFLFAHTLFAQSSFDINKLNWLPNSYSFWVNVQDNIVVYDMERLNEKRVVLSSEQLKTGGFTEISKTLFWNSTQNKVLIYTNPKKSMACQYQRGLLVF